jgi:hypothetical protein
MHILGQRARRNVGHGHGAASPFFRRSSTGFPGSAPSTNCRRFVVH